MTQKEPTTSPNNAIKLRVILSLMDERIAQNSLEGIAIWSNAAIDCMIHIEVDNDLLEK